MLQFMMIKHIQTIIDTWSVMDLTALFGKVLCSKGDKNELAYLDVKIVIFFLVMTQTCKVLQPHSNGHLGNMNTHPLERDISQIQCPANLFQVLKPFQKHLNIHYYKNVSLPNSIKFTCVVIRIENACLLKPTATLIEMRGHYNRGLLLTGKHCLISTDQRRAFELWGFSSPDFLRFIVCGATHTQ